MPSGGIRQWTDEKIEVALRAMAVKFGRCPSVQEMRDMGRNDLCCAIGKYGGLLSWAERLGLTRQFSDSDFGWQGEIAFVGACDHVGLHAVRTTGVKAPWDVTVESCLRIDVKVANRAEYDNGRACGWFYRIAKKPQADLVVLWQADLKEFYGIPWWFCPVTNITITDTGGKYVGYRNNWPLIRKMIATRREEMAALAPLKLATA